MPQGPFLRKYGVQTTVDFQLFETDGVDFKIDAAHASGDTTIMKDEGAEANTTNGFTDEGQGYSIVLTATEMEAARVVVYVVDQGTKAWLDTAIVIETYGHASAMHAMDFDDGNGATLTEAGGTGDQLTAITSKTGNLPSDPADASDIAALFSALDTLIGTPADTDVSTDIANVAALVAALNNLSAADVNAEVLDVLNVDTFAQPGQGAPAATTSIRLMLAYLYKAWRNKTEQTSSQYSLYNDDAATVDHKAAVSDDSTTFTKGEVATGP